MTITRPFAATALSANDAFKLRYPRYLKGAVLAALALTALFVWLFPGYEPVAYQLKETEIYRLIEIPDPPVVEPPKIKEAVPPPPDIRAAPDDDPDALETIPDLVSIDHPVGEFFFPPQGDEGFIESSANPVLTHFVKADYPEIARRAKLEGTVLVHALVGPTGRVLRVKLIRGAHPILDKAAVAAAQLCRFSPGEQRKVPVKTWVAIPYNFRLH